MGLIALAVKWRLTLDSLDSESSRHRFSGEVLTAISDSLSWCIDESGSFLVSQLYIVSTSVSRARILSLNSRSSFSC